MLLKSISRIITRIAMETMRISLIVRLELRSTFDSPVDGRSQWRSAEHFGLSRLSPLVSQAARTL